MFIVICSPNTCLSKNWTVIERVRYTMKHSIKKKNNNETGNALQCFESPSLYQSTPDEFFFSIAKFPKCSNSAYVSRWNKLMVGKVLGPLLRNWKPLCRSIHDFLYWRKTLTHDVTIHPYLHRSYTIIPLLFFSGPEHSRKTHWVGLEKQRDGMTEHTRRKNVERMSKVYTIFLFKWEGTGHE